MINRGFSFYDNYYKVLQHLGSEEQKAKFALAVVEYGIEGKEPQDAVIAALLQGIKPSIDNSVARFNMNSENGAKGGRPKKLTDKDIREYLEENPRATAKEVAEALGVSESLVKKKDAWRQRGESAPTYYF